LTFGGQAALEKEVAGSGCLAAHGYIMRRGLVINGNGSEGHACAGSNRIAIPGPIPGGGSLSPSGTWAASSLREISIPVPITEVRGSHPFHDETVKRMGHPRSWENDEKQKGAPPALHFLLGTYGLKPVPFTAGL